MKTPTNALSFNLRRRLLKTFGANAIGTSCGFAVSFAPKATYKFAAPLAVASVATSVADRANADITKRSPVASIAPELAAAHLINRLGFGPRPGDITEIAKNPAAWIEQQLHPESIALPHSLTSRLGDGQVIAMNPVLAIREYSNLLQENRQIAGANLAAQSALTQTAMQMSGINEQITQGSMQSNSQGTTQGNMQAATQGTTQAATTSPRPTDFARPNAIAQYVRTYQLPALQSRLWRALESPRQLEEVMVDFWFNHFNVFQGKNLMRVMVGHYEQFAIRPFALGRFKDLLTATAHHPAMMYYLDNASSVAPPQNAQATVGNNARGLNENYARELMELHTLGVDAGYEQKDVTELARMLTGWTIIPARPRPGMPTPPEVTVSTPGQIDSMPGFWFNERVHDRGEKVWLGNRVAPSGKAEGDFALAFLAKHPATAKNISFKLAQYFVSDRPSAALVERLSKVFMQEDGQIIPVLRTLFNSDEFWAAENRNVKYKTPYQYTLSALRATGASPTNLQNIMNTLGSQGMPLFGCQTPDGYKNTEAAWLNPDGVTKRINFASQLASGRLGNERIFPTGTTAQQIIENLGPIISANTIKAVNEHQGDPNLAMALVLASPNMMRR
jgi:uncharacterized protein (DUF1800 family)